MFGCNILHINSLNLDCPGILFAQQAVLYCSLRVFLNWQLFDLVNFTGLDDILSDAHCKSEKADYAQHMIIVIHETCLFGHHVLRVRLLSQALSRFEEFRLFNVTPVDLE